jgi:hypothetical protein
VVRFIATGAASGRYDWVDSYKAVLRQLADPFVDRRAATLRTRDLREATEEALSHRPPSAVIIDEAQHLAQANTGRRLQDQLDHLKYLENRTGVSHVLVGTCEMRPFRTASAQLACRSLDVHFPRYDATAQPDRRAFRSVLWALQRELPVAQAPCLTEQQGQFLYARSIGCIGLLKLHLNRARERALAEDADTVTAAHLRATALAEDRVRLALSAALAGEADLRESAAAAQRLLALLGLEAADVPGAAAALGRAAIGAAGREAEEDSAGTDRAISCWGCCARRPAGAASEPALQPATSIGSPTAIACACAPSSRSRSSRGCTRAATCARIRRRWAASCAPGRSAAMAPTRAPPIGHTCSRSSRCAPICAS